MTAAWLLPNVSTIIAAASGGVVADVLPNPQHALWKLTVSYILWGIGVPLAIFTLVLYFQRLTVYNLPLREVIVSMFLSLGPVGQGECNLRHSPRPPKRDYNYGCKTGPGGSSSLVVPELSQF